MTNSQRELHARQQLISPLMGSLITEIIIVCDLLQDAKMTITEIEQWAKERDWEALLVEYNLCQYALDYASDDKF